MRRLFWFAPIFLLVVSPAAASGPGSREPGENVGVVTTLTGTVTVARAALPSPRPLRFKDDVFVRDRIATAERSVVRVLLGGKALVTVRELSAFTVTEDAGRSAVDLKSGKIAMGVLRQRMRPGEVIEIRTPNAIAAVRGTVLVVELIPEPGGSGGAPRYTTKIHVLHGLVEVSDPRNPGAPPARVGTLRSWTRTGDGPSSVVPLPATAAEQVFAGLRSAPQIAEGPREFFGAVTTREQAQAAALAELLAPEIVGAGAGGDGGTPAAPASAQGPPALRVTDAPVVQTLRGGMPPSSPQYSYLGRTVGIAGNLYSLTGGRRDAPDSPILEAANSVLSVGQNLMDVSGGLVRVSRSLTEHLAQLSSVLASPVVATLPGGATVA